MGEKLHLSYTLDACAWTRATNPRWFPKVTSWGPSPPKFFFVPIEERTFEVQATAGDTLLAGEDFHDSGSRGGAGTNLRRGVLALWVHRFLPYGYI